MTLLWLWFVLLYALPAHAQEGKQKPPREPTPLPHTYQPENCGFAIDFPEAPYTSRKCPEENRCYAVTNYTQVFGMRTTVNFRVTCNPAGADMYERADRETMIAVLRGLVDKEMIEEYNIHFSESEGAKLAGLSGTGTAGRDGMIYTAQVWIGKDSVLTVEGELIGATHDPADSMFADILGSIRIAEPETPEENADNEKTEEEEEEEEDK